MAVKNTDYTLPARKYMPGLRNQCKAIAIVVEGAIVRAAINLLIRFTNDPGQLAMFRSEQEALAWLESIE